jgi:AraC family transcriptional regulator
MALANDAQHVHAHPPQHDGALKRPAAGSPMIPGVEVRREGRIEPFLDAHPTLSSAGVRWSGLVLEDYSVPALVIPKHEHMDNFVHVVLRGSVKYQVSTRGKTVEFQANPGTTFILPRGTVDEVVWKGPTHRLAVAIHPRLLVSALDETMHETDIELSEHWNLNDPQIMAVLLAMITDLNEGSPAGRLYGDALGTALAIHLLHRYAVSRRTPATYRGGLPGFRLRRVLDFVSENLAEDISLQQLADIAGMSPHYFAQLFKQSTGFSPHRYVLSRRVGRAKEKLAGSHRGNITEVGLEVGFQNPSHFARTFQKFVGISPSRFQSELCDKRRHQLSISD